MNPHDLAHLIDAELHAALSDPDEGLSERLVLQIEPPCELTPEAVLRISAATGSRRVRIGLPASLALAYLADEEAAVDEWKTWVAQLRRRLLGQL